MRTIRVGPRLISGRITLGRRGNGVLGADVPAGSPLANDITLPGEAADEFRAEILTRPAGGTVFMYPDSSFVAAGFPDGVHSGTYEGFKNGISYGTATYTFTIGAVAVTGDLAAIEAGSDIASINGSSQIITTGALAAVEAGQDAAALAGRVLVQGLVAAAESGADDAALAGQVLVAGTLVTQEQGSDTAAMSGSSAIFGALAAQEAGADAAMLAGRVWVQGMLAAAEHGADAASAAGEVVVSGALAAVELGADTARIIGDLPAVAGMLAAQEGGADTAHIVGSTQALLDARMIGGHRNIRFKPLKKRKKDGLREAPKPLAPRPRASGLLMGLLAQASGVDGPRAAPAASPVAAPVVPTSRTELAAAPSHAPAPAAAAPAAPAQPADGLADRVQRMEAVIEALQAKVAELEHDLSLTLPMDAWPSPPEKADPAPNDADLHVEDPAQPPRLTAAQVKAENARRARALARMIL